MHIREVVRREETQQDVRIVRTTSVILTFIERLEMRIVRGTGWATRYSSLIRARWTERFADPKEYDTRNSQLSP